MEEINIFPVSVKVPGFRFSPMPRGPVSLWECIVHSREFPLRWLQRLSRWYRWTELHSYRLPREQVFVPPWRSRRSASVHSTFITVWRQEGLWGFGRWGNSVLWVFRSQFWFSDWYNVMEMSLFTHSVLVMLSVAETIMHQMVGWLQNNEFKTDVEFS